MKNYIFNKRNCITFSILVLRINFGLASSSDLGRSDWIHIDKDRAMTSHLNELDSSEMVEQCRDWVKYSLIRHLDLEEIQEFELLYDFNPLRHKVFEPLSSFEYGEFRYLFLKDKTYAILPDNSPYRNKYLGHIADKCRMLKGEITDEIILVEYRIDSNFSMSFSYSEILKGTDLFTQQYGYVERVISNEAELKSFIDLIDDVSFVKKSANTIIMGGRKYQEIASKGVRLEDIYVLYQADNNAKEQFLERLGRRGVYNEYMAQKRKLERKFEGSIANLIRNELSDIQDLNNEIKTLDKNYSKYSNSDKLKAIKFKIEYQNSIKIREDNIVYFKNFLSYQSFYKYFVKELLPPESEANIGFSLDPTTLYDQMSDDITLITKDSLGFSKWFQENLYSSLRKDVISDINEARSFYSSFTSYNSHLKFEQSMDSFLNGRFASLADENFDLDSFIQQRAEISDEDIEADIDVLRMKYYKSINKNSEILKQIVRHIGDNSGKQNDEQLRLFYGLQAYCTRLLFFDFDQNYNQNNRYEDYEKQLYNKIVLDFAELLDVDAQGFTDELSQEIRAYQELNELEVDGRISNELFELLTQTFFYPSEKQIELSYLGSLLYDLKTSNSYQKGRYDGYLQGTEVGMTLYYTDLMMKLWSFDYENTAPQFILGFSPHTNYKIDATHKKSEEINSSTRSWLAFDEGSYEYHGADQMFFSHVATKIFDASSSDLFPGYEVESIYSSKRFSNWWNANYDAVANYESEFHRLNQIQKWSQIVHWMKENNLFSWLDAPKKEIERTLDFEEWYRNHDELKVRTSIPFLDKSELNESTECIDILKSESFIPYNNELTSYILSGGVSLSNRIKAVTRMKSNKDVVLAKSNYNRAKIDLTKSSKNNVVKLDGASIRLRSSESKALFVNTKVKNIASANAKFGKLNLERSISKNKLSQISNYNIKAGSIAHNVGGNRISLKVESGELESARKLLREISDKSRIDFDVDRHIYSSEFIQNVKKIGNTVEYLVKLKGSNNYLRIKETKIPSGPIDAPISPETILRVRKNSKNYFDAQSLSNQEAKKIQSAFDYIVIEGGLDGNSVIRLSKEEIPLGKKLFFNRDGINFQVIKAENKWYIPNTQENYLDDVSNLIRKSNDFIRKQGEDAAGVLIDKNGKQVLFGNKKFSPEHIESVKVYTKAFKNEADAIVFNNSDEIRFVNSNTLTIPHPKSGIFPDQALLRDVNNKLAQDPRYKELWTKNNIEKPDIVELNKVSSTNYNLSESYYHFKNSNNLKSGEGLIDFGSNGLDGEYVLKIANNELPKIKTTKVSLKNSLKEHGDKINSIYHDKALTNEMAASLFEEHSKPIYDMLEEVASSVEIRTFITRGDGLNAQKIYSYYGGSKAQFFADAPNNVSRSIENSGKIFNMNFDQSIFMTTTNIKTTSLPEINEQLGKVSQTGVQKLEYLSIDDFYNVLVDSTVQQIYLMIRADEEGLIFSDDVLTYDRLNYLFSKLSSDDYSKEFIYIISNNCDLLEKKFAQSQVFDHVYTSCYLFEDVKSLEYSMQGLNYMLSPFRKENFLVKTKFWNKEIISNPLKKTLMTKVEQNGSKTCINLNRFSEAERQSFSEKFTKKMKKIMKGNSYKPKSINELFRDYNKAELKKINTGEIIFKSHFKGIPRLKCQLLDQFGRLEQVLAKTYWS